MVASEKLQRELGEVEREIEDVLEVRYEVEAGLQAVRGRAGWLRRARAYLLLRGLDRQILNLKLRRNVIRNCYLETKRREESREAVAR